MQMQTEYEKHFHVQLLLTKCSDVIAMLMQRVIVQVTIVTIAVIRIANRRQRTDVLVYNVHDELFK